MRTYTLSTKLGAASLSLTSLLALGGCKAVQPKPQCKAQSSDYAAKYSNPKWVKGDDKTCPALTGEILHVQYYRTLPDDPNPLPSIAIEPASVADAVSAGESRNEDGKDPVVAVTVGSEFSLARYTAVDPDDETDTCSAPNFKQETHVDVAMVPPAPMNCPPEPDAIDPIKLTYKWSALKMMVTPSSNAVYFGAKLERSEGDDCVVQYDVTAVNPAVGCGTGKSTPKELDKDMMCVDKLDDEGKPVEEDDPFSGEHDQEKCNAEVQGTGLNQDLSYKCDEATYLCLPEQDFPKLK
jgi:hypothetical protein